MNGSWYPPEKQAPTDADSGICSPFLNWTKTESKFSLHFYSPVPAKTNGVTSQSTHPQRQYSITEENSITH